MIGKQFFTHLSMMRRFNVLLLAAMVLWGGCGRQTKKDDRKEYKTLSVKTESVILKSDYPAKFTGKQIVEIRPQISGTITRICINEGDRVRKGQTLFVIDQVPYEAALKQAEANVRIAEAKLATAKLNLESCEDLNAGQIVGDYQVTDSIMPQITLEAYQPNKLTYNFSGVSTDATTANYLVVFSEIWTEKGWKMYIDGQEQPLMRANFLLRAAMIPSGEHEIVMEYAPEAWKVGNTVSFASSLLMILGLIGALVFTFKPKKEEKA